MKSYIRNCFVKVREDSEAHPPLFTEHKGEVIVRLDGYAIVPKEEYLLLRYSKADPLPEEIVNADGA
jgi:hypothetical protein